MNPHEPSYYDSNQRNIMTALSPSFQTLFKTISEHAHEQLHIYYNKNDKACFIHERMENGE